MWQPQSLRDLKIHDKIIKELLLFLNKDEFPNLLFYGPPGTGKTTLAICFSKDYLQQNFKENFLELNASNERGINTIRTDLLDFVTHKAFNNKKKILLLDEADYLTIEAQAALRRIMEKYPNSRFILTCNYLNKIEAPIKSRCKIFNVMALLEPELKILLKTICEKNNIVLESEKQEILINNSNGDIRYIINNINSQTLEDNKLIKELILKYIQLIKINEISEINLNEIINKYIDIKLIIQVIFDYIWQDNNMDINKKLNLIDLLCSLEEKIYFGCNPKIAFISFTKQFKSIYNNPAL